MEKLKPKVAALMQGSACKGFALAVDGQVIGNQIECKVYSQPDIMTVTATFVIDNRAENFFVKNSPKK